MNRICSGYITDFIMIYIEGGEKIKKEAIYMTILSTLAANAAMFACD